MLLFAAICALAQNAAQDAAKAARSWREAHEREILSSFVEFLSIPNVADDPANIRRNAEYLRSSLERRHLATRLLEVPGAPPVVYGALEVPGATRTVTFYAHYDGQPVEPAKWNTPAFEPKRVGDSLYGRSTSDDKGVIQAILTALDAIPAAGIKPGANIRLFFEGEEEAGSPHLEKIVAAHRDLLKTDLWLICDGPVDQSRRQQIYFGARGVTTLELTVYGPNRELHSGHYGNWAPNPAMMLARLLASMKDDDGRILIPGFYDGMEPLSETEKRAIADAPVNDPALMRDLGLKGVEGAGKKLAELITFPSLNIQGLASGSVGSTARNVVPASATAAIDIRLVKGVDYRKEVDRFVDHVRGQGYFITEQDPDRDLRLTHSKIAKIVRHTGYNAARTSMDLPVARQVIAAVESARGPVVKLPSLGGSVPLYIFTDILKTPAIGIPIANHDNNQHSANENIRLQNLWDGIETIAELLAMRD